MYDDYDTPDTETQDRLADANPVSHCTNCGWSAWNEGEAAAGCDCGKK